MKALLLAAGLGTRFKPHTDTKPKPLIPFLNLPLALYTVELLNGFEAIDLVVNTFHLPDQIHRELTNPRYIQFNNNINQIDFSDESEFIRGSGGGLHFAKKFFEDDDNFIVMNADEVFFPRDQDFLKKALELHCKNNNIATLIGMDYPGVGTKFGGIWTNNQNLILGFGKNSILNSTHSYHFPGIQIYSKEIFNFLFSDRECNLLYDGVASAIKHGHRAEVYSVEGEWFETGNLVDYLDATEKCLKILSNSSHPSHNWLKRILDKYSKGHSLYTNSGALVLTADNKRPSASVTIDGFAVLGSNIHWPARAHINKSVVEENSVVTSDLNHDLKLALI